MGRPMDQIAQRFENDALVHFVVKSHMDRSVLSLAEFIIWSYVYWQWLGDSRGRMT
jgi:dTDP-D-glucose 4,6-dehydratase